MEAYAVQMPSVVFTNCKSRDLPVSVKDRKSSPAITCRPVGEGEDNTLPVISYNEDAHLLHVRTPFMTCQFQSIPLVFSV